MTISTAQISLNASTAVRIVTKSVNPKRVLIHNHTHQDNREVYIGADNVTASNGFHIPATETEPLILNPDEDLWAITGSGTVVVTILMQDL